MRAPLLRFVVTASCARLLVEGLALGVVLLAIDRTGSAAEAGWLVALSTFPQLFTGPLLGPSLDRAAHPWRVLRVAAAAAAVAVAIVATTLGRAPLVVPALAALVLATTEPLLTGGVSAVAGRGPWSTRVFAWDSLAYNVAGLAAPALVTAVAVLASPAWALAALGVACSCVAVTSLGLTVGADHGEPAPARRLGAAVRLIRTVPPLRASTEATTLAFAAFGALPFAIVAALDALDRPATDAGIVVTVAAIGGLVGSLIMTRRRQPAHPARTVLAALAATGVALGAMGVGTWPILVAGAFVMGVADGPLLVALFTVRTEHSPPTLCATVFTVSASAKLAAASIGAVVAGQLLDDRSTGAGLVVLGALQLVGAARLAREVTHPVGAGS